MHPPLNQPRHILLPWFTLLTRTKFKQNAEELSPQAVKIKKLFVKQNGREYLLLETLDCLILIPHKEAD